MGQVTVCAMLVQDESSDSKPTKLLTLTCYDCTMRSLPQASRLDDLPSDGSKNRPYTLPLHGLSTLRILIILAIGVGYASTMNIGSHAPEIGRIWGYDPSWYGIQMLFILSGFLAARSMSHGRAVKTFFASRVKSLWPTLIAATLVCALIIYPIMCAPNAPIRMGAGELSIYVFKTILLIDPSNVMPGLLDDSKYMCLLQGTIWTLRYGLILHILFLIGWKLRILQNPQALFILCIASIATYVGLVDRGVSDTEFGSKIEPFLPMLRLGYAYLVGVTLLVWQHALRLNKRRIFISGSAIAITASAFYTLMPWSSVLEILGVAFWLTVCLGFLHNAPRALQKCPRLAPALYVSVWPSAQIVTALAPLNSQISLTYMSVTFASVGAIALFFLVGQARVQSARL